MQKKYILILFCFFISNVVAQLPQNLARFTQTLKNLAAKLPAGIVPPPSIFFVKKPAGKDIEMPDDIVAPPGSTAQESNEDGLPVITLVAGGNVTIPDYGGYVGAAVDFEVLLPGETVPVQIPANKYIAVEADSTVKITLKGGVPAKEEIIPVPGSGEKVIAPTGSTVKADITGVTIKVPAQGGKVTPPSKGATIKVAVNSKVEISGKPVQNVAAGGSIEVSNNKVVTITPIITPPSGVEIKVPSAGGDVEFSTGVVIKVPKGSTVKEFPDGAVITLSSDGDVTLQNKKVIKGPAGSTIKLTDMGPDITIPVINKTIEITVPAGTGITASNAVRLKWSGGTEDLAAGQKTSIMVEGPVTVSPLPAKPSGALAPTDRKPENILKTVGNVIQLQAPSGITNAQAISGYVDVYYAFNELSRFINGKDLALTFDQFMEPTALRSIKKRRVQVACKNYIANILTKPPYLVPENLMPELKTPGFSLTFKQVRSIYHSLLSDLAGEIATAYVQNNYTNGKTVAQDSLKISTFILQGRTLVSDFKNFVDKRREYYAKQLRVSSAALSALINQPQYLESYARINETTKEEFDARHVLTELHKSNIFGTEEGSLTPDLLDNNGLLKKEYINQAMPTGRWLHEGDIAHLIRDPIVLKAVGLPEVIKDMITIFNDLSLLSLKKSPEILVTASQEIGTKFFINMQILERIVKEEQNKLHIFIVNVGFYFGGTNRSDESRWVTIARYPNNEYVIVDAQNADRTKDGNLIIIKDAMAEITK